MAQPQVIGNRVKVTATGALGDFTLSTKVDSFSDFTDGEVNYTVLAEDDTWIVAQGVATGTTLTRVTILENHLGTTANVDFTGLALQIAQTSNADSFNAKIEADTTDSLTNKTLTSYTNVVHADQTHVRVKCVEATGITVGNAVRFSGYNAGENAIEVVLGDNAIAPSIGIAEDDMANGIFGLVTISGIMEGLDTSSYTAGQILYVNGSGALTATEPTTGFAQPIAMVLREHAITGAIQINADYPKQDAEDVRYTGSMSDTNVKSAIDTIDAYHTEQTLFNGSQYGMAYDKCDLTLVEDAGIHFDVENVLGGDVSFLINGVKSTLDCTTGTGVGGRARLTLTPGTDANTPSINYIYVTDTGGVASLNTGTSIPTGAFAWLAKVIIPDTTTFSVSGAYLFQRFTESFVNDSRGALSHEREKLRALGALYYSGGSSTLALSAGDTVVHLEITSAIVYQLHKQVFPAFLTGPYYYGNGVTPYGRITDLASALSTSDGTSMSGDAYSLVIWGSVSHDGESKVFVNLPTGSYLKVSDAIADTSGFADFAVPVEMKSTAFMIARVVLENSGSTFINTSVYSLLGVPLNVRSTGAGVVASNVFPDNVFRVYDSVDATKDIALEAGDITPGQTRTLTMRDSDLNLANVSEVFHQASQPVSDFKFGDIYIPSV